MKKKLFLSLCFGLFCCLFVNFSFNNCYATSPENLLVENMTTSDLGAIYNHISQLDIGLSADYINFIFSRSSNSSQLSSDLNTLKSNIPTGTSIYSLDIAISIGRNYQDWVLIVFYVNNNQISNSLPYIKAIEETPYYFTPTYINDDLSNYSGLSYKAVLSSKKNGSSATFTTQTVSEISINNLSTSTVSDVVVYIPYFFGLRETNRESSYYVAMQDLYYKWGSNSDYKWVKNQHSVELPSFVYELPPEEPSGDVGGDISGDSSGDSPGGGFIDYTSQLNNINDNITQQSSHIVNIISGESQLIRDTISGETHVLLSELLSFDSGEVWSSIGSVRDIEFDLADSALTLQKNFFAGSPSGDLIFSWTGVTLFDTPLIPSGEYNITALIESDEHLTTLHHIIQVFAISSTGIMLVIAYWNLVLATIGANSYFFGEFSAESEALEDLESNSPDYSSFAESAGRIYRRRESARKYYDYIERLKRGDK